MKYVVFKKGLERMLLSVSSAHIEVNSASALHKYVLVIVTTDGTEYKLSGRINEGVATDIAFSQIVTNDVTTLCDFDIISTRKL